MLNHINLLFHENVKKRTVKIYKFNENLTFKEHDLLHISVYLY